MSEHDEGDAVARWLYLRDHRRTYHTIPNEAWWNVQDEGIKGRYRREAEDLIACITPPGADA